MKDNFFIDSNVALYALDINDTKKKQIAFSIIDRIPFITAQVVFECLNVSIRKLKFDKKAAIEFVEFLISASVVHPETEDVIMSAILLFKKYSLQVFDSKIVASALAAGCSILYSEDMQNGLVIDGRLTIVNPFL